MGSWDQMIMLCMTYDCPDPVSNVGHLPAEWEPVLTLCDSRLCPLASKSQLSTQTGELSNWQISFISHLPRRHVILSVPINVCNILWERQENTESDVWNCRMLEQIVDKKTMETKMMNDGPGGLAEGARIARIQLKQFLSKLGVSPKQKIECRMCWE